MKVRFLKYNCATSWALYAGTNRTALTLLDAQTGEPIAKATVNLPHLDPPADDEIDVKNWSENYGMMFALQDAGLVKFCDVKELHLGFAIAKRCKLTPAGLEEFHKARGCKTATYKVT